ncbi:Fibroblast growth factor receptor 3 [Eufriesea mexicana]|uniref:receptor protein-tyrosine kinase n=1 Tax=Eufriesea mexicana TaxID=516756 RepID=A0A310SB50_9HYME|nr:Fibroblast growth factor receptor 3 [Eufriesea mexicana]
MAVCTVYPQVNQDTQADINLQCTKNDMMVIKFNSGRFILQTKGSFAIITNLTAGTMYRYRLYNMTENGISRPETSDWFPTFAADYMPLPVKNLTPLEIETDTLNECKLSAEIAFEPAEGPDMVKGLRTEHIYRDKDLYDLGIFWDKSSPEPDNYIIMIDLHGDGEQIYTRSVPGNFNQRDLPIEVSKKLLSQYYDPEINNSVSLTLTNDQYEFRPKLLAIKSVLGSGAYGIVMLGSLQEKFDNVIDVAVKMLKDNATTEELENFRKEMLIMKFVNQHPNIVSLIGCCHLYDKPVLVVEYCCKGDLQTYLKTEFLSSNRIVHRDLAARNILVCADRKVKISDFGLSRDVYQENLYKKTGSGKLPLKWMAIEAITHQTYTTYSDVWSFGILLWEIVTMGAIPYPGISTSAILKLLKSGYRMEQPVSCSVELYNIMFSCWNERPQSRPVFTELKESLDKLLSYQSDNKYLNMNEMLYEAPEQ